MSYSKQEKPSWVKVLKICGLNIVDVGGPAVSNEWIRKQILRQSEDEIEEIDKQIDKENEEDGEDLDLDI